ncbi:mitochondrial carrier domain-containing protein [Diaporthe sp. PMI_573]|nr:mitochondrial carrier domain-containing protein [Diaporthaceae sp. PMI_573]
MEKKDGGSKPRVQGVETIAGFTAGLVTTLVAHPLDVIKTRLQVHLQSTTGPTKPRPLSTLDVARSFMKAKNPLTAAYRGASISLVANSASWACFFHFKDTFERAIVSGGHGMTSGDKPTRTGYFVAAGLAGMVTSSITNPLWLIRTRITSTDRHTAEAYPNMREAALRIYQGEGLRGFYKGLAVSFIGSSHGAIQFAAYESLRNAVIRKQQQQRFGRAGGEAGGGGGEDKKLSTEATLAISTISKVTAHVATFPHTVVRNRLQNQRDTSLYGKGISGVVGRMWQEGGFRTFYRGIVPGVLRTLPSTWVTFLVVENVRYYLPRWLDETDGGVSVG